MKNLSRAKCSRLPCAANSVSGLEALEPRTLMAFSAHVNFQPINAPVPSGYVVDFGAAYGQRGNELTYGWNVDNRAATRDRNSPVSQDQRYDTLTHLQKDGNHVWEIAVPNGAYKVHVVSGDATALDSVHRINAESTLIVNGKPTAGTRWIEGTATVNVTDGKLTLAAASGAMNAKLNFVDMESVEPTPIGTGTGLQGVYFDNPNFTGASRSRVDAVVNFNFGQAAPINGIGADTFSARWTGQVQPRFSQTYTFYTRSDNGVRLWVDHQLVINNWQAHAATENSGTITLEAGKKYDIQMEMYENTGGAVATLAWSSLSTPKAIVPKTQLYPAAQNTASKLDHAFEFAQEQMRKTLLQVDERFAGTTYVFPMVSKPDGTWMWTNAQSWTSGFFPSALWNVYQRTGDPFWKEKATPLTLRIANQSKQTDESSFRFLNTFGSLYRETGDPQYRQLMIESALAKDATFNSKVGAYRSWNRKSTSGDPRANFPVLMDHTMDLELLLWVAKETNNQGMLNRVIRHGNTVAKYLIRPDGGSYQWGYFDKDTGAFISGETLQGLADEGTWARGQAWGIHGFTTLYRETKRPEFLAAARKLSDYYIANLPADFIPYWDFNDPAIPNTFRDSSAAAIAASGMAQLSTLITDPAAAAKYRTAATKMLDSLASSKYLAEGSGDPGILLHGAWYVPSPYNNGDAALSWGDFYFMEAMSRFRDLKV